ncbi:MAG: hypothetical protein A3B10_02690 [Candidatus Doudnabacteria bacterium RIFCSPLOWO2_01_FULL_44_21]|uniref:Pseudouridine synthase n=1 Tax=Candidatus Doudnabacteria bacterium RIFCSPLOWO2_01_FULL_44_21 TaxID=1817841 RepID=A0A1F5Q214_9BACT|nr:MAG: hypothetical protein A3B95_02960 [Candidatus Doudnabacteria bacterium RIFCSPHIGHO2_02_FULL_43_13b]OGE96196.1 MAG: hypothetical protein A3B10_02690 [Candidatus Doudnabacteria bacterium RIFCSPLOWO2_01_FULL_44_21]
MLEFAVEKKDRLDKFLAGKIPDVSRGRIQKAIKTGAVSVNGHKVSEPDWPLKIEDQIELPEFKPEALTASTLALKVVFENEDFAVIDKPAGLVVHPGAGNTEDTLANALLTRFPGIENVGEPHRPGIVHRLDEYTSGLILIAKTPRGYEYFKQQFLDHKIEKEYLALVSGVPAKQHDIINLPLEKVPLKQKMRVGSGKEAITEYWVLGEGKLDPSTSLHSARGKDSGESLQVALLRVKLHTGRTHQIRAHLAHIGCPIVGDKLYGKASPILDRQFLHAARLKFQLMDGTWLELVSELPTDLREVLTKLNINIPVS